MGVIAAWKACENGRVKNTVGPINLISATISITALDFTILHNLCSFSFTGYLDISEPLLAANFGVVSCIQN